MRKRTKVFLSLFAITFIAGLSRFIPSPVAKGDSPYTPGSLEEKARKAKGGDEAAVRDLADEVFNRFGHMLPAEVQDAAKERVSRAEVEYRKKGKGGVREIHVVHAVNFLAEKFNAPDFAKTDPRQVRVLRARMRSQVPDFIAPDPDDKKGLKKKVGERMNPEVSPLEATTLMLVMLTQKALNDEFQQTPREFVLRMSRRPVRLSEDRSRTVLTVNDPRNVEKQRAVFRAAVKGLERMGTVEAISVAGEALDRLGVAK